DQGDEAALQVALGIANHLLRALQVELPYPCRIIKEADERKELVEQLPVDRLVPVQCADGVSRIVQCGVKGPRRHPGAGGTQPYALGKQRVDEPCRVTYREPTRSVKPLADVRPVASGTYHVDPLATGDHLLGNIAGGNRVFEHLLLAAPV